ncbi:MAG: hypothetical protein P8X68_13090 [Desulfobacterales bacterium]
MPIYEYECECCGQCFEHFVLPAMTKKSTAHNVARAKFASLLVVQVFWAIHRQADVDRVRHRVFPEPANHVAAVRWTKEFELIGD